jgi:hypothetical protein
MKLAMFDNIHHCHANDQLHNTLHGEMLAAVDADRPGCVERAHSNASVEAVSQSRKLRLQPRTTVERSGKRNSVSADER